MGQFQQWMRVVLTVLMQTAIGAMFGLMKPVIFCSQELQNITTSGELQQLEWIVTDKYKTANLLTAAILGCPVPMLIAGIATSIAKNDKVLLWGLGLGLAVATIPSFIFRVMFGIGNYAALFSLSFVQGLGAGIFGVYFIPCTELVTPQKWLTVVLAVSNQLFGIGSSLAIITEGLLCTVETWLISFYIWPSISCILLVVWAILTHFFKQISEYNADHNKTTVSIFCHEMFSLFTRKELYILAFGALVGHANEMMYDSFLPKFFRDEYDLPLTQNYIQSVLPNFVTFGVILILSYMVDLVARRFPSGTVLKVSNLLAAVISATMLIIMLLKIVPPTAIVVVQIVGCSCVALFVVTVFRGLTECLPVSAAASSVVMFAAIMGYFLSSYAIAVVPSLGAKGWSIVLGTLASMQILATAAFQLVPIPSSGTNSYESNSTTKITPANTTEHITRTSAL